MICTKTKYINLLNLFIALFFTACATVNNDYPDISNLEDEECRVNSSELFASIKTIALETSDSCLLSNPSLIDFCDDGIFVWNRKAVYRFDSNGHFINRIGKTGHGYGEYTDVNATNYDRKRKIIYIGTFSNDIYKYDIKGKYLGKFHISAGKDILMTSRWSESLGLYVCETRHYRADGLDVNLTTWTTDGKMAASYHVYSDNESVDRNFTRTGSLNDIDDGMLFRLPFCDTVYKLSKDSLSEFTTIDRGMHSPNRNMVEDNKNESKLEKEFYYISHWNVTTNYIYMTIDCYRGFRNVIIRLADNEMIYNQYYSYQEDDGTHQIPLKELHGNATFWPWIAKGNKVAGLVDNIDKSKNPILVIATERDTHINKND